MKSKKPREGAATLTYREDCEIVEVDGMNAVVVHLSHRRSLCGGMCIKADAGEINDYHNSDENSRTEP